MYFNKLKEPHMKTALSLIIGIFIAPYLKPKCKCIQLLLELAA